MKTCPACGEHKPLSDFTPRAGRTCRVTNCKPCSAAKARAYRENNQEAYREYKRSRYGKDAIGMLVWKAANKEKVIAAGRKYSANNPEIMAAKVARRTAAKLQATPAWANHFFIEEAYHLAKLRTEMFGFVWHVDHVVPLRSKLVCGLHTEQNLRVIPGTDNLAKGNRHWPDMP